MMKKDKDHFVIYPKVAVSGQFIGWILGLGEGVRITGPDTVIERIKAEGKRIAREYR